MKKFSILALSFLLVIGLVSLAFAALAVQDDGTYVGEATTLSFNGPSVSMSDSTITVDTESSLLTASIAIGTETTNEVAATITVQDSQGTTNADDVGMLVWLSDTAGGAESSTTPDIDLTVSGGVSIVEVTANKTLFVTTGSDGIVTVTVGDDDADDTWYVNALIGDTVISSNVTLSHAA